MRREDLSFVLFDQQKIFDEEKPTVNREITKKVLELIKLDLPIVIKMLL